MRLEVLRVKPSFIGSMKSLLIITLISCASLPNERTTTERVADAAVSSALSITTGINSGASGGSKYTTELRAIILGGFSCTTISPSTLKLEIVDAKTGEPVTLGLPLLKDWHVVGNLQLTKGEYRFTLTDHSSRVFLEKRMTYSGEATWKTTLQISCK